MILVTLASYNDDLSQPEIAYAGRSERKAAKASEIVSDSYPRVETFQLKELDPKFILDLLDEAINVVGATGLKTARREAARLYRKSIR